ncbi:hypothetical protein OIV83_000244 [Microbotryomycetes sp. JL201]|nr:hypothetical protein OIV83_000244 [Microbotryomycetes sp. JL201]
MAPRKNDSCSWKKGAKDSLWLIKKADSAEPLLRFDIQYQVLEELFSDRTFRFTAPVDSSNPPAEPIYLNFDQLYLEAILSSTKITAALRKKLIDNPTYAASFCKICFLINIGRVNTTLAFVHTMKTALRTYHPVPSLQKDELTRAELQDAPRLKAILKGAMLDWEAKSKVPTKLNAIAKAAASPELRCGPPTTIVNLLFVLFNEAIWVTSKYMPEGFDVMDLLYPSTMPSKPRAQAFLTILHHMLEDKTFVNDFDTPDRVALQPPIVLVREPASPPENIDLPDELEWVQQVQDIRRDIIKDVPAIQKRDEEMQIKAAATAKTSTASAPMAGGASSEVAAKRKRDPARSFAKFTRENAKKTARPRDILPEGWQEQDWSEATPPKSSLRFVWKQIEDDVAENRDPDYDSEEDAVWPWDLLRQRRLVTVLNRQTGEHVPVTDLPEYEMWTQMKRDNSVQFADAATEVTPGNVDDDDDMEG